MVRAKRRMALGVVALAACACLVLWSRRERAGGMRMVATAAEGQKPTSPVREPADRRPLSISGTVRTREGSPVRSARICATGVTFPAGYAVHTVCVESEPNGGYELVPLEVGDYAIGAQAEGFLPGFARDGKDVSLTGASALTAIDIILERGGATLVGGVVDATGGPIAGAVIRVTQVLSRQFPVIVQTDINGRFGLRIEPGVVNITAEAFGYAPANTSHVAPSRDLVLALLPGSSVQGTVVAEHDGRTLPDVEVRAVLAGRPNLATPRPVTSAANGAFTIQGLQPGTYSIVGEARGWRGRSTAQVQVGVAQSVEHVTVTLSSAAQVTGQVMLRADGQPCPQGSVTLGPPGIRSIYDPPYATEGMPQRSAVPSLVARIEAAGGVHFPAVPRGSYHVIVQCAQHVLNEGPTSLDVFDSDMDNLVWKVGVGLDLVVHVADEADHPLPGMRFQLIWPIRDGSSRTTSMQLVSDWQGRSEVAGLLNPGIYTLVPEAGYEGKAVAVDLRDGMGKVDAILRLTGNGSILVTVQTANSEPVNGVTVTAEPVREAAGGHEQFQVPEGLTADIGSIEKKGFPFWMGPAVMSAVPEGDGHFRISPVGAGRYRVRVSGPSGGNGSLGEIVEVAAGAAARRTIVVENATIRGRVVDSAQQPVRDAWVSATCQVTSEQHLSAQSGAAVGARVLSDEEGRFVLGGLASGVACAVRAEDPTGGLAVLRNVRPGDEAIVVMPVVGGLSGSAMRPDGSPVESFTVLMDERQTGISRRESVASLGGHWSLANMMSGQWRIRASPCDRVALCGAWTSRGVQPEFLSETRRL